MNYFWDMDKDFIRIINFKRLADNTGVSYDRMNNAVKYDRPENLKPVERKRIYKEAERALLALKNRFLL